MKSRAKSLIDEAKKHALEVMHACATPDGFSASAPSHGFHYPEIWARDNGIMTLGTLASGDEDLIAISRNYLKCMAAHQSPLGMIPLNVNTAEHHVNKENAPAVDGNLWYLLAHYALYQACPDPAWLNGCFTSLTKAYQWLRYHEWHEDGLLAIPRAGTWMDQFTVQGIALYDNALWYAASLAYEKFCEICGAPGVDTLLRAPGVIRERMNELMWVHRCWNPHHFAEGKTAFDFRGVRDRQAKGNRPRAGASRRYGPTGRRQCLCNGRRGRRSPFRRSASKGYKCRVDESWSVRLVPDAGKPTVLRHEGKPTGQRFRAALAHGDGFKQDRRPALRFLFGAGA
jgi:glycogen debranching enzyme